MRKHKLEDLYCYQMFSGEQFDPLCADVDSIHIEDIAHALSLACRFGGHCRKFYSVAQHSVLCALHVPLKFKFEALMHDATEAYIGDMVKPLKVQMPEFNRVEARLWKVIADKYGLPDKLSKQVQAVDARALGAERRDLMDNRFHHRWRSLDGVRPWKDKIVPWTPEASEGRFLRLFNFLYPHHLATKCPSTEKS